MYHAIYIVSCKSLTKVDKGHEGSKNCTSALVMELTMSDAHKLFLQENEKKNFQKNFWKLLTWKHKAQTGCLPTYIRKILNDVFINNNKDMSLKTSADFVNISICSSESVSCVVGECQQWKKFYKTRWAEHWSSSL